MTDLVMFTCAATGVPEPNITWQTTGGTIISPLAVNNIVLGSDSTLYTTTSHFTISNIQKSYDGDFICTASNDIEPSVMSNSATLTVQGKI